MKIFVKAKPGAKEEKVEIEKPQQSLWQIDEKDLHLKIWVKERPIEGRANDAIKKGLGKIFGYFKFTINTYLRRNFKKQSF